jgi:hypothetical protein
MTKLGLLAGIDNYPNAPLSGCVNDASRMYNLLCRNYDESPNFDCRKLVSSEQEITRPRLKQAVEDLFTKPADIALFFYAGHGTVNNLGGYLVTQDAQNYDEGVSMTDVLSFANQSLAREKIIILDCCHSGAFGQVPTIDNEKSVLKEGVSVLSACREAEYALESSGGGLFTSLICDALEGGAADVRGKVTVASIYAYVDEALGGWDQRPLFKSHVSKLVPIRNCVPDVPTEILRLLPRYFKSPIYEYPLDPTYEPDANPQHLEHEKIFGHLQKLRHARLVVPVDEAHMYYAAMNSKACKLTALGRFYWHCVNKGKI